MFRVSVLTASMMASITASVYAVPQADNLAHQVHGTYLETTMDANGMKVIKPGSTLVVQVDGVQANPRKNNLAPFDNTFENGELAVAQSKTEKSLGRFGLSVPKKHTERPLATGAKVYLLNVDFEPGADSLALTVQSCGDCDPKVVDPTNEPYRAKVIFKFVHGALGATDLKHVQQAIEQVFKFADADAGGAGPAAGAGQSQAPAQTPPPAQEQQQFAPIEAPPPPPAAEQKPRVIKLGMTTQEVKEAFGEPGSVIEAGGNKVIYMYKDKKVTFVNGKVSDVDVL